MSNPVTRTLATRPRFLLALLTLALIPASAQAQEPKGAVHSATVAEFLKNRNPFNLNAAAPNVLLAVNQFQCAVRNNGDTCADLNNSPINPGGFWPVGSPNAYMFNSGINMAGIIPRNINFPWAGDTVAAFFFDARGTQAHGAPLTDIYNSLDAADLDSWPQPGSLPDFPFVSGIISDTSIFSSLLVGRKAASQQDSYFVIWDGDPDYNASREHPMGILVEQRTMAWNYPAGNEATLFFVYKVTNVTNSPRFQQLNESRFFAGRNELPDGGWPIDSVYLAYDSDPDVTNVANDNFGTAILPLNLMTAYSGDFVATEFDYKPNIFYPPFFTNAPGMVGLKYLRSPIDPVTRREVGMTMFSAHTNGGAFPDPLGPMKLFRYLKGDLRANLGDPPCTFPNAMERKLCYLPPARSDVRLFAASGPFRLEPGQSVTIVAAMFAAATVNTPLIIRGQDNAPGVPSQHPGCAGDVVRPIEVAAGWVSATCPTDPAAPVDQYSVRGISGSLVGKGLAAQSVFDAKFLLPSAPASPNFALVPGDNQVAIFWQASPTDVTGDPFFTAASDPDPTNPLRDPNFRRFDVEGYRIFKGTKPSDMRLIAQFDKAGTSLLDFTCITSDSYVAGDTCNTQSQVPLNGPIVQYPVGGVVRLQDGSTLVVKADTAGQGAIASNNALPLGDTGVPFAFVDRDVRNGFRYFYKVSAFDVNSLRSGPTSLESSSEIKNTTPQRAAAALSSPELRMSIAGSDGAALNPDAPQPTIEAQTGVFSGKAPPTNAVQSLFAPVVQRVLPKFRLEATIDSVVALSSAMSPDPCAMGHSAGDACWQVHMTFSVDGRTEKSVATGWSPIRAAQDAAQTQFALGNGLVRGDTTASRQFGLQPEAVSLNAMVQSTFAEHMYITASEGHYNRRIGTCAGTGNATCLGRIHGGSRWFAGTTETVADPARYGRAGQLPGVDTVLATIHHTPQGPAVTQAATSTSLQCFAYAVGNMGRAADVQFTWGSNGFSSVRDVTHNVNVIFKANPQASYGFLNTDANGNGFIDWDDFQYLDAVAQTADALAFCGPASAGGGGGSSTNYRSRIVRLESTPRLQSVSASLATFPTMARTGNGFGLYVNGERYIFQMSALPNAGTVWTLRSYAGEVATTTGNNTIDPGGYTFTPQALRSPLIPGLKVIFQADSASRLLAGTEDLKRIHTVPDPYYGASLYDIAPRSQKQLLFVNVPTGATLRIYTLTGILVDVLNHTDQSGGGQLAWDLRNRSGQFVASGVYFFHVSLPDGRKHIGRFTIINSGT